MFALDSLFWLFLDIEGGESQEDKFKAQFLRLKQTEEEVGTGIVCFKRALSWACILDSAVRVSVLLGSLGYVRKQNIQYNNEMHFKKEFIVQVSVWMD